MNDVTQVGELLPSCASSITNRFNDKYLNVTLKAQTGKNELAYLTNTNFALMP